MSRSFKRILAISALLSMVSTGAFAEISGLFKSEPNKEGQYITIEFGQCADKPDRYCGTIAGAYNADTTTNSDYAHIGRLIVWDMKLDRQGKYKEGRRFKDGMIWAPDDDKTYQSKMKLYGDTLKVKGCVARFLCRGQEWVRVEE